jgi:aspartate carbamoyltransferase regulatory subunit
MMMTEKEMLPVGIIQSGTVIDHITVNQGLRLVKLLKLEEENRCVTIGICLPSPTMGKKDLIKVEGKHLTSEETSTIAIFSPNTTITVIEEGKVLEKFSPQIPEQIEDIVICPNRCCITHTEKTERLFYVKQVGKKMFLSCKYCEKSFERDEIQNYTV